MINFIDILGIVIIIICAFLAFKKGFVKTFFGFISAFLAIILAFLLCDTGVEIIKNNTGIDEWLGETLTTSFSNEEDIDAEVIVEENETVVTEEESLLGALENLPENVKELAGFEEYKNVAQENIIRTVTDVTLKILSWVIIYIVVRVILAIICFICNGIMSIPLLKQINNLAGLALGVIMGFFRIYVALALISFLVTVVPLDGVVELIKSSLIISVMYENNILISLIF